MAFGDRNRKFEIPQKIGPNFYHSKAGLVGDVLRMTLEDAYWLGHSTCLLMTHNYPFDRRISNDAQNNKSIGASTNVFLDTEAYIESHWTDIYCDFIFSVPSDCQMTLVIELNGNQSNSNTVNVPGSPVVRSGRTALEQRQMFGGQQTISCGLDMLANGVSLDQSVSIQVRAYGATASGQLQVTPIGIVLYLGTK